MGNNVNLKVGDKVTLGITRSLFGVVTRVNNKQMWVRWSGRDIDDRYWLNTRTINRIKGEEIIDRLLNKYS